MILVLDQLKNTSNPLQLPPIEDDNAVEDKEMTFNIKSIDIESSDYERFDRLYT